MDKHMTKQSNLKDVDNHFFLVDTDPCKFWRSVTIDISVDRYHYGITIERGVPCWSAHVENAIAKIFLEGTLCRVSKKSWFSPSDVVASRPPKGKNKVYKTIKKRLNNVLSPFSDQHNMKTTPFRQVSWPSEAWAILPWRQWPTGTKPRIEALFARSRSATSAADEWRPNHNLPAAFRPQLSGQKKALKQGGLPLRIADKYRNSGGPHLTESRPSNKLANRSANEVAMSRTWPDPTQLMILTYNILQLTTMITPLANKILQKQSKNQTNTEFDKQRPKPPAHKQTTWLPNWPPNQLRDEHLPNLTNNKTSQLND